jgi:ABC transporter
MLVGPSGSGKSAALRMVAGLEDITEGTLKIGNKIVNQREAKDRDLAMVFQNYALYPHMTVRQNMAFPLKLAKTPRDAIDRRVVEAGRILAVEQHLDRKPANLSGGQRHRVAMGRAIVRNPKAFLMDEPLSTRPRPQESADAAPGAAPLADLGPGPGDARLEAGARRRRHRGVLLRSARALAARDQREHQRAAQAVLPQGLRLLHRHLGPARRRRRRTQRAAAQALRLRHPNRATLRAAVAMTAGIRRTPTGTPQRPRSCASARVG